MWKVAKSPCLRSKSSLNFIKEPTNRKEEQHFESSFELYLILQKARKAAKGEKYLFIDEEVKGWKSSISEKLSLEEEPMQKVFELVLGTRRVAKSLHLWFQIRSLRLQKAWKVFLSLRRRWKAGKALCYERKAFTSSRIRRKKSKSMQSLIYMGKRGCEKLVYMIKMSSNLIKES